MVWLIAYLVQSLCEGLDFLWMTFWSGWSDDQVGIGTLITKLVWGGKFGVALLFGAKLDVWGDRYHKVVACVATVFMGFSLLWAMSAPGYSFAIVLLAGHYAFRAVQDVSIDGWANLAETEANYSRLELLMRLGAGIGFVVGVGVLFALHDVWGVSEETLGWIVVGACVIVAVVIFERAPQVIVLRPDSSARTKVRFWPAIGATHRSRVWSCVLLALVCLFSQAGNGMTKSVLDEAFDSFWGDRLGVAVTVFTVGLAVKMVAGVGGYFWLKKKGEYTTWLIVGGAVVAAVSYFLAPAMVSMEWGFATCLMASCFGEGLLIFALFKTIRTWVGKISPTVGLAFYLAIFTFSMGIFAYIGGKVSDGWFNWTLGGLLQGVMLIPVVGFLLLERRRSLDR